MATGGGRIERGCDFGRSEKGPVRLAFLEIGGAGLQPAADFSPPAAGFTSFAGRRAEA
jgi:hypothetical protein